MSGRSTKPNLEQALSEIPIFPLPRVVLFPRSLLPLRVFEPRYRRMLADCLASHGAIAIATLASGEDEHGRPNITSVCGGGIVVEHQPLPDGQSNIVVLGQARLALEELEPAASIPYRRARAQVLAEIDAVVAEADHTALVAAATMFAREVTKHDANFSFQLPRGRSAGEIADLCAFQLVIDGAARQSILEELDPRERVAMVIHQLALQHGAMLREAHGALN
jgi:uncharacterized protein